MVREEGREIPVETVLHDLHTGTRRIQGPDVDAAALTVLAMGQALGLLGFKVPLEVLEPGHWIILMVLPLLVAIVARATARITVLRTLSKMA